LVADDVEFYHEARLGHRLNVGAWKITL